MSNPKKAHYNPVFYLSRWANEDGLICRFSRPYGVELKKKWVAPSGTSFERNLYSVRIEPEVFIPEMECDFMSPLDSQAATALCLLEDELPDSEWQDEQRSDWSRFVWAQLLRTPQEMKQLKSMIKEAWNRELPELEIKYQTKRSDGDPLSLREYQNQTDPGHEDRFALSIARTLFGHEKIVQIINNMRWSVLQFEGVGIPLLTSDNPVWMTHTFSEDDAFLTMPIGPATLFMAAVEYSTLLRLNSQKRNQLAKIVNKYTVQHAMKYVYGVDEEMFSFVNKHISTKKYPTIFERLSSVNNTNVI